MSIAQDALPFSPPGPLGTEAEFTALIEGMVAEFAPRLFAVVQEYGERLDGRLAAWGLAFDDHVEVLDADGRHYLSLGSVGRAAILYAEPPNVSTRVVWWRPASR